MPWRPRFTVRRLMVAVAIMGLICGVSTHLYRRSAHFHRLAVRHHSIGYTSSSTSKIEHHLALSEKYERASRYPWLSVEPDPPEPN